MRLAKNGRKEKLERELSLLHWHYYLCQRFY
jgi:hypothetical protein